MGLLNIPFLLFLLTIPVVILFYLLRLRRKELVVSSTLLWQQMTQDIQANAPLQRLRMNILLILQVIVLLMLGFALARPFIHWRALSAENTVLIIDNSASMQATDVRPNRLEAAKRHALKMVDDLSRKDKMMVIAAGGATRVVAPLSSDKQALKAAIQSIRPTDTTTDMREAVVLGLSLVQAEKTGGRSSRKEIYILSDGNFPPLSEMHLGDAQVYFVRYGKRADNVAITAMDVRRTFAETASNQVLVTVTNFSDQPKKGLIELYHDDSLFSVEEMSLDPRQTRPLVYGDLRFEEGLLEARLDVRDDLAVDNRAYALMSGGREVAVLLVTRGNQYLEKVLRVDDRVILSRTSPDGYEPTSAYDIVIFDNWAPDALGDGAFMLVNAAAVDGPVEISGEVERPTVVDWERRNPITRYVNFRDIHMSAAKVADVKPWARKLVEAGGTTIVAAGEKGGTRCIYVGFPLNMPPSENEPRSDFPMKVGFPIFISNCLDWLARDVTNWRNVQARAGDAVQVRLPNDQREALVTTPDGRRIQLVAAEDDDSVAFNETDRIGLYEVKVGEEPDRFVVNLLSRAESDITPQEHVTLGATEIAAVGREVTSNRELWRLLALLGLVVLSLEWYIYHRRI